MKTRSSVYVNALWALVAAVGLSTNRLEAASVVAATGVGTNGHEYAVVRFAGQSWDSARADVLSTFGQAWHLATVTDAAENDFINSLREEGQLLQLWLGGYQDSTEGNDPSGGWNWVNDEGPITTFFWAPSEPNDADGPGSEQHLTIGRYNDARWNDERNLTFITGYVAERAPRQEVPEGGAALVLLGLGMGGLLGVKRMVA